MDLLVPGKVPGQPGFVRPLGAWRNSYSECKHINLILADIGKIAIISFLLSNLKKLYVNCTTNWGKCIELSNYGIII